MKSTPFLSKSKYLSGLQCSKLLWYYYNAKSEIPEVDVATQAIFDQGHVVGEYAKQLFPDGIEVKAKYNEIEKTLDESLAALKLRNPLFETGFKYKDAYARADILNPVGKDAWDIIEVKSSTEVKDVNLQDVALQLYVYKGAGVKIRKCWIYFINNQYVRKGDIVPEELFSHEDITKEVEKLQPDIEKNLQKMVNVIQLAKYPEVQIGSQCSDPYGCPLIDLCWDYLPEGNPTTLYYYKKEKAFELIHSGVVDIRKLPNNVKLSDKQTQQVECHKTDKPYIDTNGIREFLSGLKYPLYFLDFETFNTAIPLFDDIRPYQNIPFQYSLHILEKQNSQLEHFSFLADGKEDPRSFILQQLKKLLGSEGSVVAYNASFEKGVLKNAVEIFQEYKEWYATIEERFIDLLVPFKSFYYYNPKQNGSASIKAVLPALTGLSYKDMEIAEGGTASNEFLRVTFSDVIDNEREQVRNNLLEYCKLDTMGMVEIVHELERIVNK
jgi:hypothetical protein